MNNSINFKNKILFSKYKIKSLIGKGEQSKVYLVENIQNKKLYAAKIEKKVSGKLKLLENDSCYLYYLKGFGIPKIITYGQSKKYTILIQQLLGKTLKELFEQSTNKIKDLCMSAIQIIERIEYIHSKYILHLDIKPENFLVGNPDSSTIYIIDFGFSKKYRSSRTKKHIIYKINKYFSGTVAFLSLNATNGVEQSRRDDLESLAYSLIYLFNGTLPWINIKAKTFLDYQVKMYDIKKSYCIKDLCKNLPKEFVIFIEYVRKLKFEEEPNYNMLKNLFIDALKNINEENDYKFSWMSQSDRKKYINQSKRSCSNSLNKRKSSPRKRMLEKLREISKNINNKSVENNNNNIFYNNIINLNMISEKEKSIINLKKEKNLTQDINKNTIEKNEIKTEQNISPIFSPRIHLNKLKKTVYINSENYSKNILKTRIKNNLSNNKSSSEKKSENFEKSNTELNSDISYIPKTKKVKLMYEKLLTPTILRNPNNLKNLNKINYYLKITKNEISHKKVPNQENNSNYLAQSMIIKIDQNNRIPKIDNIKKDNLPKMNNIISPTHYRHLSSNYNSDFYSDLNDLNFKTLESNDSGTNYSNDRNHKFNFIKLNNKINTNKCILINENSNF